jgi:hypothetical protein
MPCTRFGAHRCPLIRFRPEIASVVPAVRLDLRGVRR